MSIEHEIRAALIKAEVDRAMAPYVKAPAFLRGEMRKRAERYFHENPHAKRALDMLVAKRIRAMNGETGEQGATKDEK